MSVLPQLEPSLNKAPCLPSVARNLNCTPPPHNQSKRVYEVQEQWNLNQVYFEVH